MEEDSIVYSLAEAGIKKLCNFNSDIKCAEIFINQSKYVNIEVEENSIKHSEVGTDEGISVRTINQKGSLGFSYSNCLSKEALNKIISTSVKLMKNGTSDIDFRDLPTQYETYPKINNLYDEEIANLPVEEVVKAFKVTEILEVCESDDAAISQSADFSTDYLKTYIFNTNGVEISGKSTSCSVTSNMILFDKFSKTSAFGFDYQVERELIRLEPLKVAQNALESGKRNLKRKKVSNMTVPLILTPKGVINLILRPLSDAINAETYQYKRSFLVDKLGEKIGSSHLNIRDDALIEGGAGSSEFDAEGVPCKNKLLIDNGTLLNTGLLHNSYTAGKDGVLSTGNATRSSYQSTPSIGITNLILKPGNTTLNEIITSVKEGIILDYTGDRPNVATGDFSGLILHGNYVCNGEIKESLNETMLGINLMQLYNDIEMVSKECKTYGPYRAPYIKISKANVIGSSNQS